MPQSHVLKEVASRGALASRIAETPRSESSERRTQSAGSVAPSKRLCSAVRTSVRPSSVSKSPTTALTSSLASGPSFDESNAPLLARNSWNVPHKPLGSAAEIAAPTASVLSRSLVHSSAVKSCLLAIGPRLSRRRCDTPPRQPIEQRRDRDRNHEI